MGFERNWHKWYAKEVPGAVEIKKKTMPEILKRTAKKFPEHTAFIYMGKRISFKQLESLVTRFAWALKDLGVKKGEKVGMVLPNIPQVVIANQAVYKIGAVAVMNNPLYTEKELQYQLNDSDTKVVVILDLFLPRILKIKGNTKVEKIIACHINDYLPFPKKQLFPFVKKDMHRKITPQKDVVEFMDLIQRYSDTEMGNSARWDETAALLYTGGTTGVSKGAVLTHENISSAIQQFTSMFYDLNEGEESILGVYPIFHAAGYSVSQNMTILKGWTCILIPRPEPDIIVEMLKKFKPTFLPGVPTIYTGLLNNKEFTNMDLAFVKGYFAGAAPLPDDTSQQLRKNHGAVINDVYGATENTAFAVSTPWRGKIKKGTVGVPLPNTDIKIVDLEKGETILPPGEEGEICIQGPQVMKGYYKKEEDTKSTIKDGWFHTGDIGFMDDDGYLTVVDRKKDIIISSGYNVYPKEIDEVLFEHPKILEACSFGVPDEYRGEKVKACVVQVPGEKLLVEDIILFCKARLAAYKVPREIVFTETLPKSAVGKVLRRELREIDRTQCP